MNWIPPENHFDHARVCWGAESPKKNSLVSERTFLSRDIWYPNHYACAGARCTWPKFLSLCNLWVLQSCGHMYSNLCCMWRKPKLNIKSNDLRPGDARSHWHQSHDCFRAAKFTKNKMINGIMLMVIPCPFVQVSLRRCHLEMTDWIVVPGAWVPNPRNADGCTPVAFWGLGFGKVKALLRKPRHQHLLVGDPLNSVG